ncbi:hypothetical protein NDU88_005192 [Pleurodeles waltl]|uniref:Uncharacterized protein n=1 Tax=Pleurodeles waltl TaxID=8319 RepID=A0AAV7QEB1_PLEWA|nr:hypothetical protein NDU88_005192 [Pleurodeles waltl]
MTTRDLFFFSLSLSGPRGKRVEKEKYSTGPRGKRVEKEECSTGNALRVVPLLFSPPPSVPVPFPFCYPFPALLRTSRLIQLVPHPVPGEATLLLKRGGSFVQLPGVSGRLPGFLAVPIPAALRSSTKRRLLWLSQRLLRPRTPVPPSSYFQRRLPEGKEDIF